MDLNRVEEIKILVLELILDFNNRKEDIWKNQLSRELTDKYPLFWKTDFHPILNSLISTQYVQVTDINGRHLLVVSEDGNSFIEKFCEKKINELSSILKKSQSRKKFWEKSTVVYLGVD